MVDTENRSLNGSIAIESQELIFNIVITTLYSIVALLALIYSLPILCIRRFQHRNNIFTLNVCLTTTFTCLLWLPTAISPLFGSSREIFVQIFPWLYVLQAASDMAIPYSLVLVSFHRCCFDCLSTEEIFQHENVDDHVLCWPMDRECTPVYSGDRSSDMGRILCSVKHGDR